MKTKKYVMSISDKIDMVHMSIQAIIQGYANSRMVQGIPGVGKSKAVIDELTLEKINFLHISGGIKNAKALYLLLYDNNDPDTVIVFDDVNIILKDKECIEILRAAVDTAKVREINFADVKLLTDKKHKPNFILKSKIIVITNIKKSKIDTAILSRTNPIEILATPQEMFEYVKINMVAAPPRKVPLEWKTEVIGFIQKEVGLANLKHFDFRIFQDCILWKAASMADTEPDKNLWKKIVYNQVT